MKQLTSAILLLVASTLATAVEPDIGTNQSLVVAYNDSQANVGAMTDIKQPEYASSKDAEKVLAKTLEVVSASLTVELDMSASALFAAQ